MKFGKYGVRSDLSEPIAGVGGIGLDAVRNSVPITPLPGMNVLRNAVAPFPAVQQQEQSTEGGIGVTRSGKEVCCRNGEQRPCVVIILRFGRTG